MFRLTTALAVIAALAVPAAALAAETPATYVMKAGASDLYEKQSSQAVLKTSKNAQVRRFATGMIGDHGKTTATVTAAARAAKLPPKPPMLDAPKAAMVRQLNAARGIARDRLYIQQQKTAHQEALALHQSYAAEGTEPNLKAAAASAVPIVQQHLEMLNGMKM